MPRQKGSQNKITKDVKDAVERAFSRVNGGGEYLIWLSREHPACFVALVSKCIPATVAVDVRLAFDLGSEMLEANNRLRVISDNPIHLENKKPHEIPKPETPAKLLKTKED